jgi:hypothetical protein
MHAYFPALNSYPSLLGVIEKKHISEKFNPVLYLGYASKWFKSIRIYMGM